MTLTRYVPRRETSLWRPFLDLQTEINRLFSDAFGATGSMSGAFVPPLDVYEKDDKVVVKADLPGINRDDIQVTVHDGLLTLRGSRNVQEEVKEEHYSYSERVSGSFTRTVQLPAEVDANKITATFKDGVLTVEAPKRPEALPRTVEVKVS